MMIPRPTKRAFVDIGHKCNIKCLMCYNKHEVEGGNACFVDKLTLKYLIKKAKDRGNTYIDFTGGEPTIHPNIIELVDYCGQLDLKCCIITNGLAGEGVVESIINAGIDDWLISTHGTTEVHDRIVQLPGTRARQERFIKQLQDAGSDFRFNFCMISHNQNDIIATAKWAVGRMPRIVNFIQMNPHLQWQKQVEETKSIIGDLNVLEAQLSAAIPILLDAGIGVNVRYYPMCRIPELFRMCVCNDLQVMFDPYEWDYEVMPKNFKTYYNAGVNMSNCNEWKAQPCLSCSMRFICGGINSAFYRACGDKAAIYAIKDDTVVRDDIYHYRRHNSPVCLTDRVKTEGDLCIAAIADENMAAYVPLFLYCALKAYPDYDVKVFANYPHHDQIKGAVDRFVGYGIYESNVVNVHTEMAHYGDSPNVTRAIRFVEFEEHLKDYKNVLWTDIDILFQADGDLVKFHSDIMAADGTVCYENYITVHEHRRRLCGVHFITREWWEATAAARISAREEIKNDPCPKWELDEMVLLHIVERSGLIVSPIRQSSIKRHHGIHLGDYLAEMRGKGPAPKSKELDRWISSAVEDTTFIAISEECGALCENIKKVISKLVKMKPELSSVGTGEAKNEPIKKKTVMQHFDGSLLIFTLCNEEYQWYVPMFLRSLELAGGHEADVSVLVMGKQADKPFALDGKMLEACGEHRSMVKPFFVEGIDPTGWNSAAMRFLVNDGFEKYDFCLITDVDILLFKEPNVSIIDQHMHHLKKDGTDCYENWISQRRGEECRMPGVHFVTKEWWEKTEKTRGNELQLLKERPADEYCYDEFMIGRIVRSSMLAMPPSYQSTAKLWRHHGVHLGDWRLNIERKRIPIPDVFQMMHIDVLLKDEKFMQIAEECSRYIDFLGKVIKKWPMLFR